ncbi:hypothetical protein SAMN05421753_105269 [Planctomicrobium piriforme]|uniref:Uncharacterized protein n=1 Tax=Planctomicrobium piriforme TaxID=1576369 RepID=A0A1I3FIP2_9PLAN|nr:hypothetical protein SAMN05421753_105269 [Planctomicrobium piriforme]
MPRPRHPNKHIEAAIRYAEVNGWKAEISNAHAFCKLYCPQACKCLISVWSTPKVPENHARRIRRDVDLCGEGKAQR